MAVPRRQHQRRGGWTKPQIITLVVLLCYIYVSLSDDGVLGESAFLEVGVSSTNAMLEAGKSKVWTNFLAVGSSSHLAGPPPPFEQNGDYYFMKGRTVEVVKPRGNRQRDKSHSTKKLKATDANYDEIETERMIQQSQVHKIPSSQNSWVLSDKLEIPTRNHDSILFDVEPSGRQLLLILFGRNSPNLQWIDLQTGTQKHVHVSDEKDPAGMPLSTIHHATSAVVDSLSIPAHKEVWIPCGFHGEQSNEYARIVDLKTMEVKVGPKMSMSRGACVAAPIHVKGPSHPAHVCVFGGTYGEHNEGSILPYTGCYDRVEEKWHHPFGRLPVDMDHASLAHIPAGVCGDSEPERLLLFNFRQKAGNPFSSEIFAFDIPTSGWSSSTLNQLDVEATGKWYSYAIFEYAQGKVVNAPRDASGMAIANGGRNVIDFGGVKINGKHKRSFSTIRSFDVCEKAWSQVGDMGLRTFGFQSSVAARGNIAVFCGGHSSLAADRNSPWCVVNRIPGMQFQSNKVMTATNEQIAGML
eukprot:scaffold1_cov108-Cylindrotheca_fusiformis.AAC.11